MKLSTPARALVVLAVVGAGLSVAAPTPSARADDPVYPYPFDNSDGDETITLMDQPGWASSLVTRGGTSSWVSETLNGTVAQEYGLTTSNQATVSDELRHSWVDDEPFQELSRPGNVTQLTGADDVALGYLNDDHEVDAAYLVKGTGGADDQIHVFGSQPDGFPQFGSVTVDPGALSITITEPGGSPAQPAYIFIRYADHLGAVRFDPVSFELQKVTVIGSPSGTLLDMYHRGTWLDPGQPTAVSLAARRVSFAVLADTGGATDTLTARMLAVTSHTDGDDTADPPVLGTVTLTDQDGAQQLLAGAGRTWSGHGRVRYDWWSQGAFGLPGGIDPRYGLAIAGRDSAGHNQLAAGVIDEIGGATATIDSGGAACGDHTPLEIDVESYAGEVLVACASVDINGNADRLVQNMFRGSSWLGQHSNTVDDQDRLGQLHPRIILPCALLVAAEGHSCSTQALGGLPLVAGNAALQTTVAGGVDSSAPDPAFPKQYQTGDSWLDVSPPANPGQAGRFLWTPLDTNANVDSTAPLLVAPLPIQANEVDVKIPDSPSNPPVLVRSKPIPVAFLAAPPQVGGAGQEGDAPEFASTSGSSSGTSTSTSSRVGVHVGMEYEDPLGANGVAFEVSLESEVSDDTTTERTITTSQAFRGLMDQDVVVYRTVPTVQWRGTVVRSSTGVGVGTQTSIDFPGENVVTSAASVSSLARTYPDLFGPTGQLKPVLDEVFNHDVGDPGSYLEYGADGQEVEDYCDGALSAGGDRQLKALDPLVPGNPYLETPEAPPLPDILLSDQHDVLTGTGNAEGATFAIDNSTTNSRVQTTSLDVSVTGKAGYIIGGVNGGHTWGTGWSSTISDGAEFSSFVGHLPSDNPAFDSETYSWRSFLCQKTVGDTIGAPISAWVLDYTVDGYNGSGGLAPLSAVHADGPAESASTDPKATVLRWSQDSGTVETYDWRLEAVGVHDVRTGQISFATPKESKETNTPTHDVPVGGAALLPGQLYRWKVVATDFFGNESSSDWEFFVTGGGPTANNDRASGPEDHNIVVDVSANDVNPGGGPLALAVADDPVHGAVSVQGGALKYDPKRNFCGLDSFDYRTTDAQGRSSVATVSVRIRCVNDAPVAVNDRLRMPRRDRTLGVLAPGPLGNDRDAEHDDLSPKLVRAPKGVDVEFGERGALFVTVPRRTPRTGTLKIKYRACDEEACSDVGVITIVLG